MDEVELIALQARIDSIGNLAAHMLKFDSPAAFVDAAIEMAFRIDAKVTERVKNGN